MNIMLIGSGGREHTLLWKIRQSPLAGKVVAVPGNGGMAREALCIDRDPMDFEGLKTVARDEKIDYVVVGPEAPLVAGIADYFRETGIDVFGPSRLGAMLEGSKIFAKELMTSHGVPTGEYRAFSEAAAALSWCGTLRYPAVIKADGLAAGKGVIIADNLEEAAAAIDGIMRDGRFGKAGERIIVEEYLEGEEVSILAFTDGEHLIPMISSQDHKKIYEGDRGPNTGGMGACSPAPVVSHGVMAGIRKDIMTPTLAALREGGIDYRGVLYFGLILTGSGPKVLEFNCRFGDPEIQAVMQLLESDLLEVMMKVSRGQAGDIDLSWRGGYSICVVMASKGYPGSYEKGKVITGLDSFGDDGDVIVFHAGTAILDDSVVTSGGRVLGVTARGKDFPSTRDRVYEAVGRLRFEGAYYRRDIGHRAIAHLA